MWDDPGGCLSLQCCGEHLSLSPPRGVGQRAAAGSRFAWGSWHQGRVLWEMCTSSQRERCPGWRGDAPRGDALLEQLLLTSAPRKGLPKSAGWRCPRVSVGPRAEPCHATRGQEQAELIQQGRHSAFRGAQPDPWPCFCPLQPHTASRAGLPPDLHQQGSGAGDRSRARLEATSCSPGLGLVLGGPSGQLIGGR